MGKPLVGPHVFSFLAGDSLEGRGTGQRGLREGRKLHGGAISRGPVLEPAGVNGYRPADRFFHVVKIDESRLLSRSGGANGKVQPVKAGGTMQSWGFSSHAAASVERGCSCFVGYGAHSPGIALRRPGRPRM